MKITKSEDKFTLELSGIEVRALRSLAHWAEMLEENGQLEIFEYQKEFIKQVKEL